MNCKSICRWTSHTLKPPTALGEYHTLYIQPKHTLNLCLSPSLSSINTLFASLIHIRCFPVGIPYVVIHLHTLTYTNLSLSLSLSLRETTGQTQTNVNSHNSTQEKNRFILFRISADLLLFVFFQIFWFKLIGRFDRLKWSCTSDEQIEQKNEMKRGQSDQIWQQKFWANFGKCNRFWQFFESRFSL